MIGPNVFGGTKAIKDAAGRPADGFYSTPAWMRTRERESVYLPKSAYGEKNLMR